MSKGHRNTSVTLNAIFIQAMEDEVCVCVRVCAPACLRAFKSTYLTASLWSVKHKTGIIC